MLADLVLTAVGLGILLAGAWLLVRSAALLAVAFGLSPVIVGATVVAFGTSAPEFVVSLAAGIDGRGGLAVGNVLGSNVTNVALVLGLAAVVRPMAVHPRLLRWEMPVLAAATGAVLVLGAGGSLGHVAGAALFVGLVAFIVLSLRLQPDVAAAIAGEEVPEVPEVPEALTARAIALEVALLVGGIVALAVGSEMAVRGAIGVAERVGMSEVAIGVTVVAVGTSLPEVLTSAVAALRGDHEIAVANVVGSNVFNLLGVLGLTAALVTLPIDGGLYRFEMPALAISTAALLVLGWRRGRIGRIEGLALLAAYVAFVTIVLVRGGS
ncbi:MAG: calcium/sodium antiporter [Chloroflexi bacterium]|nr:calcium/sodium antiporter [Chloroflexota bacterium]